MSLKQITLKDYLHMVINSVLNDTNKKIVSFLKDGDGDYHRINAEIPIDEDYRYEIYNKDGRLIEEGDGYVCLETAIKRALESDGEYIKRMWYPIGEDGELNADDCSLIGSDVVWERGDCM